MYNIGTRGAERDQEGILGDLNKLLEIFVS